MNCVAVSGVTNRLERVRTSDIRGNGTNGKDRLGVLQNIRSETRPSPVIAFVPISSSHDRQDVIDREGEGIVFPHRTKFDGTPLCTNLRRQVGAAWK
jgi:hypothetical protein